MSISWRGISFSGPPPMVEGQQDAAQPGVAEQPVPRNRIGNPGAVYDGDGQPQLLQISGELRRVEPDRLDLPGRPLHHELDAGVGGERLFGSGKHHRLGTLHVDLGDIDPAVEPRQ